MEELDDALLKEIEDETQKIASEVNQVLEDQKGEKEEVDFDIRPFLKKLRKQFALRKIVDGTFVASDSLLKYWKMIMMVFGLALLLIALNYEGEKRARNVTKLKKELKELRYMYMATKTELMSVSSQSYLATKLDTTGIKESVIPPVKIIKGHSYGKRD